MSVDRISQIDAGIAYSGPVVGDCATGRQLVGRLLIFCGVVVGLVYLLALAARSNYREAVEVRRATIWPEPLTFLTADPQFRFSFGVALDRNFFHESGRISGSFSPALMYLDKQGVASEKLVERYDTLWRLLEHLQLRQDYRFEKKALEVFRLASTKDVFMASGRLSSEVFQNQADYVFLTDYGLAWYLDTYYIQPATALIESFEIDRARRLSKEAADRFRLRGIAVSEYKQLPQINRAFLIEALLADPVSLLGNENLARTFLRIFSEDFPIQDEFTVAGMAVSGHLQTMQGYVLGVYAMRHKRFAEAEKRFMLIRDEPLAAPELRDLSTHMMLRCKFWGWHAKLVHQKKTLNAASAEKLAHEFEVVAKTVRSSSLRANGMEYAQLIRSDFTNIKKLKEKLVKTNTHTNDGKESRSLSAKSPLPAGVLPQNLSQYSVGVPSVPAIPAPLPTR